MTNYIELIDEKLNLYNQLIEKRKNYLSNLKFKKQLIKNAEKNIGDTVDKKIREKYGEYKEGNYNGYILNIRKNLEIFEQNRIEKALKKLQEEDYTKVYDKLIIDIASKSKEELLNLKKELEDYGKKLADEINEVNAILMNMNIDSDGKILNRNERIVASKRSKEIKKEQKYLITCLNKLAKALSLVSLENYQEINLNQKEQEKYDEILNKITKKDKVVNEDVSTIEDESKDIEDSNSKLSVQAFELLTTIAKDISASNIEEANSNLEKVKQILEKITDEKAKENLLFWVNKYTDKIISTEMSMDTMNSPIIFDAAATKESDYARENGFTICRVLPGANISDVAKAICGKRYICKFNNFEIVGTKYQNPEEIVSAYEEYNDEIKKMVNTANEILSFENYDAAKTYIDSLPEFNGKKDLENKVAELLKKIEELVKKAEIDQSSDSYNNAMGKVNNMIPSEEKKEFLSRLEKVSEIINSERQVMSSTERASEPLNQSNSEKAPEVVASNASELLNYDLFDLRVAKNYVEEAETNQSSDSYNHAMRRVNSLAPSEEKKELLSRLERVSEIINSKKEVMSSTERASETLNQSNSEKAPEAVVSNAPKAVVSDDISGVYKSGGNLAASIYDSIQQEIKDKNFRVADSNKVSYVDYKKLFSALEKYYEQHKATDYVFINSEGKKERCKIKFANIKRLKNLSAKSITYVYDSNLKELKPVKGGNYIDEKELVLNFDKLFQVKKNSWIENLLNEKLAEIEDENNTKGKKIVK